MTHFVQETNVYIKETTILKIDGAKFDIVSCRWQTTDRNEILRTTEEQGVIICGKAETVCPHSPQGKIL
jgi:hypothetical protein